LFRSGEAEGLGLLKIALLDNISDEAADEMTLEDDKLLTFGDWIKLLASAEVLTSTLRAVRDATELDFDCCGILELPVRLD
jgi:hypothetical protein